MSREQRAELDVIQLNQREINKDSDERRASQKKGFNVKHLRKGLGKTDDALRYLCKN